MRVIELVLRALMVEDDSSNTQMLLGGLMLCVQDLSLCEQAEQTLEQEENGNESNPPPSPGLEANTGQLKQFYKRCYGYFFSVLCFVLF